MSNNYDLIESANSEKDRLNINHYSIKSYYS